MRYFLFKDGAAGDLDAAGYHCVSGNSGITIHLNAVAAHRRMIDHRSGTDQAALAQYTACMDDCHGFNDGALSDLRGG